MTGQLIVEAIEVKDFMSYYERQEIALGGAGATAVVGLNGVGKSTLVSKALAWCLFGQCAPERMGSGTKAIKGKEVIRNRERPEHMDTPEAKSAHAVVKIRRGNEVWRIHRIRPSSGGDKITVDCLTPGAEDHVGNDQGTIDRLVGCDYAVFVRTCLRGQGDVWNFAEATDAKKRSILDTISGAVMLEDPHKKAVDLRKHHAKEAESFALRSSDAERRADDIDPSEIQVQAATWGAARQARLDAAKGELAALAIAHTEAADYDAQQGTFKSERAAMDASKPTVEMGPYNLAVQEANKAVANTHAAMQTATNARAQAEALISAGNCPTCGQGVGEHSLAHQVMGTDIAPLAAAYEAAKAHQKTCQGTSYQASQWLTAALAEWDTKYKAIPVPGPARTGMAQAAVKQGEHRVREIEAAENPHAALARQAEAQAAGLRREAVLFREAESRATHKAALAAAWEETLSPKGVRAHLAEGALAAIEAEANRWLSVMSDGRLSVTFPATRGTRTGSTREEIQTVIRSGNVERSMLTFSGGEKRRINFAVDLGVATTFSKGGALALSLLVLDEEVFSGLDAPGKAGVVAALQHAGVADVVIIDHDPVLTGVLARTVRVELGADGYSRAKEV